MLSYVVDCAELKFGVQRKTQDAYASWLHKRGDDETKFFTDAFFGIDGTHGSVLRLSLLCFKHGKH